MSTFPWLLDKLVDIIVPQIFSRLKHKWKDNPRFVFIILASSILLLVSSGGILNTILYMPILFLDDDRPLRLSSISRANNELKHINDHLPTEAGRFVEASPYRTNNRDFDSWTYANILVALGPDLVSSRLKYDHSLYFKKWMKPSKHCWTEGNPNGPPCHIGATAWALVAMSMNSIKPSKDMWLYLLQQQNSLGWWSLYEDSGNDQQNASTYSTAVALWALHIGLTTNMIPEALVEKSKVSLERAKEWLFSKRNRGGCLWSAYPDRSATVEPSLAISGFVIHKLLILGPEPIKSITDICLNALTTERPAITEWYQTGESVPLNDGKNGEKDGVRHQKLILTILALGKLYPMLSITDKARVRRFVESTLFPDPASVESKLDYSWQKAEFALMIRSILYNSTE
jgi:hypothetical protein